MNSDNKQNLVRVRLWKLSVKSERQGISCQYMPCVCTLLLRGPLRLDGSVDLARIILLCGRVRLVR